MIRKRKSLTADMGKVTVVSIEDQISYSIPPSQVLVQSMALTLFNSYIGRGEETAEEIFEDNGGWFMRFKERSIFNNINKYINKVKQQVLM